MRVLASARDMGAANMLVPMVPEFQKRGCDITLLAEEGGIAHNRFNEKGVPYTLTAPISAEEVLDRHDPKILVTGLAGPRHFENDLDFAARTRGIPVVNLEDYWGVHARSCLEPDLFVTIDETAVALIREKYQSAAVCVAGLISILPFEPRPEIREQFEEMRATGVKIVLFADGGLPCEPNLKLTLASLAMTKMPWRLCTSFHPKAVNAKMPGSETTWGERWNSFLRELRNEGMVFDTDARGDETAMLADATCSSYSSLLFLAAAVEKHAISLWTPESEQAFFVATERRKAPLLLKEGYPVLRAPYSLDAILASTPPIFDVKPFDARVAVEAILRLA